LTVRFFITAPALGFPDDQKVVGPTERTGILPHPAPVARHEPRAVFGPPLNAFGLLL
jgi:hypothetical protein